MTTKPTHRAHVASHTPGRLRIKIGGGRRNPKALDRIKTGLEATEGIHSVQVSPATGSVTLHYDPKRHSTAGVLGLLEDMDVIVESLTHAPSVGEAEAAAGGTLTVGEAIDDLNERLQRWTRLPIDLRAVLPLSFMGAGLWSIFRNGLMLEKVPGWMLLWVGFDLFVKTRPTDVVRTPGTRREAEGSSD
jgi:Zn-dependent membrane protease YugP